ncbi:Predicted amidohydrolase [Sinosporangium album]|uniref:Predicted amidohydrolase n=1 Tax=Sinosporangium album TaxID=504805 RepID=A0A1G8E407_9ACTN|nr:nitrilase-related carbon-nitrogen hydrolase [Sinosporangium album]SDH64601.1 Predicted amidohydrolase [Sinosporangium album]
MSQSLTVSCVQLNVHDNDREGTVRRCLDLVDRAAEQGAKLVVIPEMWNGIGFAVPEGEDIAEPVPGPSTDLLAERARRHGLYIVGSLYATAQDGSRVNLAPVIGPEGTVLGSYAKSHLFDAPGRVDIPVGVRESDRVRAGSDLPVIPTEFGPLGVAICADLRFPEVFRTLALRGARIIVLPSAFLSPRMDHWEFFMRARATENQVYMVAANQSGTEPVSGLTFVGRSMVVDPWGTVVATASDGDCVVTTHLDLGLIDLTRERFPLLAQRRPELYGELVSRATATG